MCRARKKFQAVANIPKGILNYNTDKCKQNKCDLGLEKKSKRKYEINFYQLNFVIRIEDSVITGR